MLSRTQNNFLTTQVLRPSLNQVTENNTAIHSKLLRQWIQGDIINIEINNDPINFANSLDKFINGQNILPQEKQDIIEACFYNDGNGIAIKQSIITIRSMTRTLQICEQLIMLLQSEPHDLLQGDEIQNRYINILKEQCKRLNKVINLKNSMLQMTINNDHNRMDISQFDLTTSRNTGGMKNSSQVNGPNNIKYQLKAGENSNNDNKYTEIFTEFVAAQILNFTNDNNKQHSAKVYLVTDASDEIYIASEYIQAQTIYTLDQYMEQLIGINLMNINQSHFTIVPATNTARNQHEITVDMLDPNMVKNIIEAIVCSAFIGDHDINPGNIIVHTNNNYHDIARIDFGHAFCNLTYSKSIVVKKFFGGGLECENIIIDFFNREKIIGVGSRRSTSKLLRDYPGLVQIQLISVALNQFYNQYILTNTIKQGLLSAHNDFATLIEALMMKGNLDKVNQIIKSLSKITDRLGFEYDERETYENPLNRLRMIFDNFEKFIDLQIKNVHEAMIIATFQTKIETIFDIIEKSDDNDKPTKENHLKIAIFREIINQNIQIEKVQNWIRIDSRQTIAPMNVVEYYNYRRNQRLSS